MSTMTSTKSTRDMCQEHAESLAGILTELWQRIAANPEDNQWEGEPDPAVAQEELDQMPLEIVWERGEPFAVVFGTGGPHVEIRGGTRHDGMTYAIHVYWSGEHVAWGHASEAVQQTGRYFRELVEETTGD